jgi:hypothetical protein
MDGLLQEIALGLAQVRYWDLRNTYNLMIGELELAYPGRVDYFVIDPDREKVAREWFAFFLEHEGWSFLLFDPCDITACLSDEIEELGIISES